MFGLQKSLIWPDSHLPFHNIRACKLVLEIAQSIKVNDLVLLGDFADFYHINSHGRDPAVAGHLKEEIDSVNSGLDTFDRLFPDIKKTYLQGNHEFRLERYIQNRAPELFGMLDCQSLFKIQSRPGWRWIPYEPSQRHRVLNSKLYARHEPLGVSAKATASRALCSVIHGHDHAFGEQHMTSLTGEEHIVCGSGWLGDVRKAEIFNYVKGHHNWQLGFTIVYVNAENGYFYRSPHHILDDYTCVVEGKLYRG